MGKSTALKHLALSWADGSVENLNKFDYVFHIALKDLKNNDTLESIIVRQHKGLSGSGVQPFEMKHLLEGYEKRKILLLLDGYDEYLKNHLLKVDCMMVPFSNLCTNRYCCTWCVFFIVVILLFQKQRLKFLMQL